MSNAYPDPPGQPPYSPPPPTANPYGSQYGPPQQQPYGQPYAPQQAYPPQPDAQQPYGPTPPAYNAYNYPPPRARRPRKVIASSVLSFVLAAVSLLTAALALLGALLSSTQSLDDTMSDSAGTSALTSRWAIIGTVQLVLSGLLFAGGIALTTRHRGGRILLAAAAGIVLIECVYSLVVTSGGSLLFALILVGLAGGPLILALSGQVSEWLNADRQLAVGGTYSDPSGDPNYDQKFGN